MNNSTKIIRCNSCKKEFTVSKYMSNKHFLCKQCKDIKNTKNCLICGKEFIAAKKTRRFCSNSCSASYKNIYLGLGSKAGRASAEAQKEKRRSKNEILFYNLCKKYFENIDNNKRIFNGWDADVIIHDIKYAILWNGVWHYKKITEKHSLKQVQNRDKIKIDQINKFGYTPYIIKDMGKYNEEFVKEQFNLFIKNIG